MNNNLKKMWKKIKKNKTKNKKVWAFGNEISGLIKSKAFVCKPGREHPPQGEVRGHLDPRPSSLWNSKRRVSLKPPTHPVCGVWLRQPTSTKPVLHQELLKIFCLKFKWSFRVLFCSSAWNLMNKEFLKSYFSEKFYI